MSNLTLSDLVGGINAILTDGVAISLSQRTQRMRFLQIFCTTEAEARREFDLERGTRGETLVVSCGSWEVGSGKLLYQSKME